MTSASVLAEGLEQSRHQAPPAPAPLWEFVRGSGLRSLVVGASKDPNAKITVLLVSPSSGRTVLAVKVPTTDAAARAVEAEGRALAELRHLPPGFSETIPRVVDWVDYEGRPGVVMTAVQGTPMSTSYMRWRNTARPARVGAHFAAVDGWLAEFQRETAGRTAPLDMDCGVSARLASRFAGDDRIGDDLERLAEIHARLATNAVPSTAVHGDLWFGNVLLAGERASGVVDWEAASSAGQPARDLVRFAVMYALFLDRRTRAGRAVPGHPGLRVGTWGAGVEYALDGNGWFPDLFRAFLRDGLGRLGASPDLWRDAALAGIAEVAALTDDFEFAHRNLELFRRTGQGQARRKELE